jgi:hypothetical protein
MHIMNTSTIAVIQGFSFCLFVRFIFTAHLFLAGIRIVFRRNDTPRRSSNWHWDIVIAEGQQAIMAYSGHSRL